MFEMIELNTDLCDSVHGISYACNTMNSMLRDWHQYCNSMILQNTSCASNLGLTNHWLYNLFDLWSTLWLLGHMPRNVKFLNESGSTNYVCLCGSTSTSNLPVLVSCSMTWLIELSSSKVRNAWFKIHWLLTAGPPASIILTPTDLSTLTQVFLAWWPKLNPQPLIKTFLFDNDINCI